jgi:hypothetical protein
MKQIQQVQSLQQLCGDKYIYIFILWRAVATQRTASYRCHIHGNEYRELSNYTQQLGEILLPRQPIRTDMCFSGNQPSIMHFGMVEVGDRYSVSPEATLGPTPGEIKRAKRLQELRSEQLRSD